MPLTPEAQQMIPPEPEGDPELAKQTMGAGNRTVLPLPLSGHYDVEKIPTVTIIGATSGTVDELRELWEALDVIFDYTPGEYTFEVPSGRRWTAQVGEHRRVLLNVQIDDDSGVTLLDTLVNRLQIDADEIRAPVAAGTIPIVENLVQHGFVVESDEPVTPELSAAAVSVAPGAVELVWRRP